MNLINHTFKLSIVAALVAGATALSAQAQTLKTLGKYQATVIESESKALSLYNSLPTAPFKSSSGCFQRAHNWSFQLSRWPNQINSMKVFLFFTERYKREFDYEWMYHVAPLIPVKMANGSVEEMVFDPTFVNAPSWATGEERNNYDNKPVSIDTWKKYFIFPDVECPVVENFNDYFNYQERYYCYIMKTPMFTYIPANLEEETEVRTGWREGDMDQMKKAFKLEYR